MKIRIQIKTPKGNASGTVSSRKWLIIKTLLNLKKKKGKTTTNKKHGDDTILWEVEGTAAEMFAISKRVMLFDDVVSGIFQHKWMKKALKRMKYTKDQMKEVEWMLKNMTKIKVLKSGEE